MGQSGEGEPLVLIHGLASSSQIWSAVAPALATRRRVVTLDLPGFGASVPVGPGFELEAVAQRIARSLAAHRVRAPFDLVGHSLGAAVTLTLAVARPRLVRRLVLVAPAGLAPVPWPAARLAPALAPGFHAARRRAAGLAGSAWGRRLLLAFTAADGAGLSREQTELIVQASAAAQRTAAALRTITATDLRPQLAASATPLGLLWGSGDLTVPARTATALLHARPDAELELIARAGHVVMLERPAAFLAALERVLARLDNPATTPSGRPSILV